MGRAGYTDDCDDQWALIRWRGAVKSAIRGKRGQAFLKETLAALDALPEKRLITDTIEDEGSYCTLGAVARARGSDLNGDLYDAEAMAGMLGVPHALAAEIVYENDEWFQYETPEQRFERMRKWVAAQIKDDA